MNPTLFESYANLGPRVSAVGDSITSLNGLLATQVDRGYLNHAALLSAGKFVRGLYIGGSGYTTSQMLALLTTTLAAGWPRPLAPRYMVVLGGGNDISTSVAMATIQSNLTAIYAALVGHGIQPVLGTYPPSFSVGSGLQDELATLNAWIEATATTEGWPLVDFYSALVDAETGAYVAAYTVDGTHPSAAGAAVMGQVLSDVLTPIVPSWPTPYGNEWLLAKFGKNPLVLADTDANGFPDYWYRPWGYGAGGADLTKAFVDAPVGRWWQMSATSNGAVRYYPNIAIKPGDLIVFGCRVQYEPNATSQLGIGVTFVGAGAYAIPLYTWNAAIDGYTFQYLRAPAGTTSAYAEVTLSLVGAATTGTVRVGQFSLANLTALGLA